MSSQFGMEENDFLRQIVSYEYPTYAWEKGNFSIREEYHLLIKSMLKEMKSKENSDK